MFNFLYLASVMTFIVSIGGVTCSTVLFIVRPSPIVPLQEPVMIVRFGMVCGFMLLISSLLQLGFGFASAWDMLGVVYGLAAGLFCLRAWRRYR